MHRLGATRKRVAFGTLHFAFYTLHLVSPAGVARSWPRVRTLTKFGTLHFPLHIEMATPSFCTLHFAFFT